MPRKKSRPISKEALREQYEVKEKSLRAISKEFNVSLGTLVRLFQDYGLPMRTKGEAQTLALAKGRKIHPTKGKKLNPETRIKISNSVKKWFKEQENGKTEEE